MRNKLQCIFVTNLLQIPADLLLDCRCYIYKTRDGFTTSWDSDWDPELSKYNKVLERSPFYRGQNRHPISTETFFNNPSSD